MRLPGHEGLLELAKQVIDAAVSSQTTLSCAESCTGGMIASSLTAIPGSSQVFLGGVVSYAASVKERLLGVAPTVIQEYGVVSQETARLMAKGACRATAADIAVSTTGIAGPGGAEPGKPVGTVCFGLSLGEGVALSQTQHFTGDREEVRRKATAHALKMFLDALS